jgi:hypothetical protein
VGVGEGDGVGKTVSTGVEVETRVAITRGVVVGSVVISVAGPFWHPSRAKTSANNTHD